ncbi:unnamed protein product, partial [Merluccius merluccius]
MEFVSQANATEDDLTVFTPPDDGPGDLRYHDYGASTGGVASLLPPLGEFDGAGFTGMEDSTKILGVQ